VIWLRTVDLSYLIFVGGKVRLLPPPGFSENNFIQPNYRRYHVGFETEGDWAPEDLNPYSTRTSHNF
jgi:hypothetical protein